MPPPRPHQTLTELVGNTPVVRLQRVSPKIFLKLETFSPLATFFDRVTREIAACLGAPRGSTVIDGGEGPYLIALASQCAVRGWSLLAFLPEDETVETRQTLQVMGVDVRPTPFAEGVDGALRAARAHGPVASEHRLDAELKAWGDVAAELSATLAADGGRIDALVTLLTSGAQLAQLQPVVQKFNRAARLVCVQPASAAILDGEPWKPHRQHGHATSAEIPLADALQKVDRVTVTDDAAWRMRERIGREEGLLVSVASAAGVEAAAQLAATLPDDARVYCLALDTGERFFSLKDQFVA